MYVDEVGNADMGASGEENHRYLSLTGVVMTLDHAKTVLVPAFDDLKRRYFVSDPDQRIVFHRKELLNQKYPFQILKDLVVRKAFDEELLGLLRRLDYLVITAVIDKAEHQERYGNWANHPYHYCMEILLERFVLELRDRRSRGDVMAESRGTREDRELGDAFRRLVAGTANIRGPEIEKHITSRELKLKKKSEDVAGLQLADLIAHASCRGMRLARRGTTPLTDFGSRIERVLKESKYRRSYSKKIDGWGTKWLP